MDNILKAAQAVIEQWDKTGCLDTRPTSYVLMNDLRQAVEQAKGVSAEPVAFCPESKSRDEQIRIALKYWAKDVSFKNKHELIDALLGLCVTDGIGGDGIVLWKPAKDAINGILNTTPPSVEQAKGVEAVLWWNGHSKICQQASKDWDARTGGILSFGCDIPLYTTPPSVDALIAEIEAIETFGVSGGHGERSSQAISVWKLKPILDKYRGV